MDLLKNGLDVSLQKSPTTEEHHRHYPHSRDEKQKPFTNSKFCKAIGTFVPYNARTKNKNKTKSKKQYQNKATA